MSMTEFNEFEKKPFRLSALHISIIAAVVLVIILFVSNPGRDRHAEKVDALCKETMAKLTESNNWNPLASLFGGSIVGKLATEAMVVDSYGILSLGKFKGADKDLTVTVGILGMVFTTASSDDVAGKISQKMGRGLR